MQFSSIFKLKGNTAVFLTSDAASELTNAVSRLCWKFSFFPRWLRGTIDFTQQRCCELRGTDSGQSSSRTSNINRWTWWMFWECPAIFSTYIIFSVERTFFSQLTPMIPHRKDFGQCLFSLRKPEIFGGRAPRMAEPTTKPVVLWLEAVRTQVHLHWLPMDVHENGDPLCPRLSIEFPFWHEFMVLHRVAELLSTLWKESIIVIPQVLLSPDLFYPPFGGYLAFERSLNHPKTITKTTFQVLFFPAHFVSKSCGLFHWNFFRIGLPFVNRRPGIGTRGTPVWAGGDMRASPEQETENTLVLWDLGDDKVSSCNFIGFLIIRPFYIGSY